MKYELRQLPSGFWSIWIDGQWVDAASKTEAEAKAKAETFLAE